MPMRRGPSGDYDLLDSTIDLPSLTASRQ